MAATTPRRPYPVARPFILTFAQTGAAYPASSEEVERLIANYPVKSSTRHRVVLIADGGGTVAITPATYGGGDAFTFAESAPTARQKRDFEAAHVEGLHDETSREFCPLCEQAPRRR